MAGEEKTGKPEKLVEDRTVATTIRELKQTGSRELTDFLEEINTVHNIFQGFQEHGRGILPWLECLPPPTNSKPLSALRDAAIRHRRKIQKLEEALDGMETATEDLQSELRQLDPAILWAPDATIVHNVDWVKFNDDERGFIDQIILKHRKPPTSTPK